MNHDAVRYFDGSFASGRRPPQHRKFGRPSPADSVPRLANGHGASQPCPNERVGQGPRYSRRSDRFFRSYGSGRAAVAEGPRARACRVELGSENVSVRFSVRQCNTARRCPTGLGGNDHRRVVRCSFPLFGRHDGGGPAVDVRPAKLLAADSGIAGRRIGRLDPGALAEVRKTFFWWSTRPVGRRRPWRTTISSFAGSRPSTCSTSTGAADSRTSTARRFATISCCPR